MRRVLDLYENKFFPGRNDREDHPKWEPVHEAFLSRNIPAWENVGGDIDKKELNGVPTRTST